MFQITFLGTGSSSGVPVIGCDCHICSKRINFRRRCSALLVIDGVRILIDVSPDFREQALQNSIFSLDYILCTHEHYDHFSGALDLGFVKPIINDKISLYCSSAQYKYIGISVPYLLNFRNIKILPFLDYAHFFISGIKIETMLQFHGSINSVGFIVNDIFAYCTDLKYIYEKSLELLMSKNLDLLVLQCLSIDNESKAHLNLREAILLIKKLHVKTVYITHMSHYIDLDTFQDKIDEMCKELNVYTNIKPAIDGLNIRII